MYEAHQTCWLAFSKSLFLSGLQDNHLQEKELEWLVCHGPSVQPDGKRLQRKSTEKVPGKRVSLAGLRTLTELSVIGRGMREDRQRMKAEREVATKPTGPECNGKGSGFYPAGNEEPKEF